jgi:acetone carboxylase gamma subunit
MIEGGEYLSVSEDIICNGMFRCCCLAECKPRENWTLNSRVEFLRIKKGVREIYEICIAVQKWPWGNYSVAKNTSFSVLPCGEI